MKILIFHSVSSLNLPSGEKSVALSEYKNLIAHGHDTVFIEYKNSFFLKRNNYLKNFYNLFSYIWNIEFFLINIYYLIKYKPDVVHVHSIFPSISSSCFFAIKIFNIPVIQTLHNVRWLCLEGGYFRKNNYCDLCLKRGYLHGVRLSCKHNKFVSLILYLARILVWSKSNKQVFKLVDKFIAVSDFIKEQHIIGGMPNSKIVVKYNPINTTILQSLNTNASRSGIVYYGRISKAKGSSTLKYISKHINTTINVIGDGPDLSELKEYCKTNDLDHVHFWNHQTQEKCFEIISSSICTVVPSVCGESFSLTAAESMALSTPVVGFNVGGLSSLIINSGGGLLVDANSDKDFLMSVKHLIKDQSYASTLGSLGQKYVKTHLNPELNTIQLISIYNEVIKLKKIKP